MFEGRKLCLPTLARSLSDRSSDIIFSGGLYEVRQHMSIRESIECSYGRRLTA